MRFKEALKILITTMFIYENYDIYCVHAVKNKRSYIIVSSEVTAEDFRFRDSVCAIQTQQEIAPLKGSNFLT